MGSYAELFLTNDQSPALEGNVIDSILSKWYVPLGWLALYEPQDFKLETEFDEDLEEDFHVLYSTRPVGKAISLIQERSSNCEKLGGDSWTKGLDFFLTYLKTSNAEYVHVAYSGLADDEFPAFDQQEFYIAQINNMKFPSMDEKKSLFGGTKLKRNKNWEALLPEGYKPGKLLPYWAWFGAPPGTKEDWGDT